MTANHVNTLRTLWTMNDDDGKLQIQLNQKTTIPQFHLKLTNNSVLNRVNIRDHPHIRGVMQFYANQFHSSCDRVHIRTM